MIKNTGVFNISILTVDTPFKVFEHFGFSSVRDCDKFADFTQANVSENGIKYVTDYTNAVLSAKVIESYDYDSITLFIAEVTGAISISNVESLTYQYYLEHVKPKKKTDTSEDKKGYVCKICGYVHEGDELPDDFICPLCKHGVEDFDNII